MHHRDLKKCYAPEHFSITDNPEETLLFFDQVYNYLRQEYSVSLQLESVRKITSDAILYMLSLLDMFKNRRGVRFMGNAPVDERCRHIFMESGFYEYVDSKYSPSRNVKDILAVRSENRVVGRIAQEVVEFAHDKVSPSTAVFVWRKVYTTILECMGNTREHAYTGREKYQTKWWLMALHDESKNRVTFAILDNGAGIPKTVKKKIMERFWTADSDLILSALRGEFRTRMNELWRGKGLPKIFKTYEAGIIQNLAIISNKGYVNYGSNQFRDLKQKFFGTLVSWTISEGKNNA